MQMRPQCHPYPLNPPPNTQTCTHCCVNRFSLYGHTHTFRGSCLPVGKDDDGPFFFLLLVTFSHSAFPRPCSAYAIVSDRYRLTPAGQSCHGYKPFMHNLKKKKHATHSTHSYLLPPVMTPSQLSPGNRVGLRCYLRALFSITTAQDKLGHSTECRYHLIPPGLNAGVQPGCGCHLVPRLSTGSPLQSGEGDNRYKAPFSRAQCHGQVRIQICILSITSP